MKKYATFIFRAIAVVFIYAILYLARAASVLWYFDDRWWKTYVANTDFMTVRSKRIYFETAKDWILNKSKPITRSRRRA